MWPARVTAGTRSCTKGWTRSQVRSGGAGIPLEKQGGGTVGRPAGGHLRWSSATTLLVERLGELGYKQVAGDRFARAVNDIPAGDETDTREAVIEILLSAYSSRPSQNRRAGDLVATEALGLATALQRPPLAIEPELQRLNGELLEVALSFPDEPRSLVLKTFATRARHKPTDHTDVWRCLEIAHTADITPDAFSDSNEMSEGADLVRSLFSDRPGPGISAMSGDQG